MMISSRSEASPIAKNRCQSTKQIVGPVKEPTAILLLGFSKTRFATAANLLFLGKMFR
jgi:hypothetical protein